MVNSNGIVSGWLDDAKKNAGWLIVLGVVTVIAGFFSLVMPWASGVGVALFVGLALVVGGAARLIGAFSAGSFGRGTLAFIGGALCLLAGVIMVARPGSPRTAVDDVYPDGGTHPPIIVCRSDLTPLTSK